MFKKNVDKQKIVIIYASVGRYGVMQFTWFIGPQVYYKFQPMYYFLIKYKCIYSK